MPELLRDGDDQDQTTGDQEGNEEPMVVDEPKLEIERARHGDEEVEVDERSDEGVEDLLHEGCTDYTGERRAANQSDVHEERGERADVHPC